MELKAKRLLGLLAAGAFALSIATGTASAQGQPVTTAPTKEAQPEKKAEPKDKTEKKAEKAEKKEEKKDAKDAPKVEPGVAAPDFTLKDTAGNEVTLSSLTGQGKIVVLEWFNPGCPFVVKHHELNKTFAELNKKYADKGVVFLAINSGAKGKQGFGQELNASKKKDWGIEYPVLLDETGKVGKLYNAKRTPEMFVIGKDGKVAYMGAIDDNDDSKTPGKVNYVAKALDEILAGKEVTTKQTRPYGCSVKY
ncbi:MAG: thioredoxin family protein [Planctomycetota bacterium]|nr:thioredoxin family protein [Planctomycetota bacterium]